MLRLQDTANVNIPVAEADLYLNEALRVLCAQTQAPGIVDYTFDFNPGDTWKSLNVAGSPRERTVTDTDLYTQIEAMLYEPMSGGTWTGTTQFNITQLANSLQYRRDELLLASGCNTVNLLQPSPLLSTTTILPDSTLDLQRVRWMPADSSAVSPYALGREDVTTRDAFGVLLTIKPGAPDSWMITANSPLEFDCSCPPNQPGTWDMLVPFAGVSFVPPAATAVGIPDDWTPALVYGVLADVLANSPEGRDETSRKVLLAALRAIQESDGQDAVVGECGCRVYPCRYAFIQADGRLRSELGADMAGGRSERGCGCCRSGVAGPECAG